MRLKGINPIEQHFEKGIAGVFALALLGAVAWQFVGKPNMIKIGGKDEVPIDQAYEKVGQEAKRVLGRLEATNIDKPAGGDVGTESLRQFQAAFKGPIAPAPELATALDRGQAIAIGEGADAKPGAKYAELALPQTAMPVGATHLSTIDASEIAAHSGVADVLPKQQPFDLAAVTIETKIDGPAIKAALTADPDGAGPILPVPERWWAATGIQIIGVELQRETMQPDGSWSEQQTVKTMPGRQALPGPIAEITNATQLKQAMKVASEESVLVRRPPYYMERFGEKWTPPTERRADGGGSGGDRASVEKEIVEINKRLKQLQDALAKVGQPGGGGGRNAPPPPPAGGGGRGGGGKGAGGGGGGAGGGSGRGAPPPPGNDKADEVRRKQIQANIDRATKQLAAAQDRLDELDGKVKQPDPSRPADATTKPKTEPALLDTQGVRLWAHDVFVERGKTYRYRVILALNNPFFGHSAAMLPEQAALAQSPLVRTPASEWSEPVTIEHNNYFFITSASTDDQVTRGSNARAEVFEFKWGYWRRGAVQLEPGDRVNVEIKYPDLSQVAATPAPDAPAPPAGGGGGGGGGRVPGGGGKSSGGGAASPGGGAARPPAGGGGGDAGTPATAEPIPMKSISVSRDTLMLGVSSWLHTDTETGKSSPTQRVLLREADSSIVIRVPLDERELAAYQRISRNAETGVKALEPNKGDNPNTNRPNQPQDPGGGRDRDGGGPSGG